ncbi:hypothetical protein [Parasitella parasitica]|uniref:Uncharacterized protein n=1 Tax=Parasitella parasitica TaxID=35722 RepID=A0A0B7NC88_9FUNG|nr:hypothetical protein [Parasitella parasitica]
MRFSLTAAFVGSAALISTVFADFYNCLMLTTLFFGVAESAKYFIVRTILTTSHEDDPNGIMLPELKSLFPNSI